MMEGVSHHSFLLDLNGGELLLLAFTLTALKAGNCLNNPIFLLSFPLQVFLAMGLGDRWYVFFSLKGFNYRMTTMYPSVKLYDSRFKQCGSTCIHLCARKF